MAKYIVARPVPYQRPAGPETIVANTADAVLEVPFECLFWVGASGSGLPVPDRGTISFRMESVGRGLDLLLQFRRSQYQGEIVHLPNTSAPLHLFANTLEVVELRRVWVPAISRTWPPRG